MGEDGGSVGLVGRFVAARKARKGKERRGRKEGRNVYPKGYCGQHRFVDRILSGTQPVDRTREIDCLVLSQAVTYEYTVCGSWILNQTLQHVRLDDSSLVKLLRVERVITGNSPSAWKFYGKFICVLSGGV